MSRLRIRRGPGRSAGVEPELAFADTSVPLPAGAEAELRSDNPRLAELRTRYAAVGLPASRWDGERVARFLDLCWFRGETLITWHYREEPRLTRLKFFVFEEYVRAQDRLGLLERLAEDAAFGCWTYEYPGRPRVSRDLLDSVLQLNFLERRLHLSASPQLRVLDIGAGYGRLAHRMTGAFAGVEDYCCTDGVPESTFVSEYYLRHRGCTPPARVVALDEVAAGALEPGSFDLAVNIHAWPEIPLEAIAWWIDELVRLRVPRLFVIPNEATELLSLEPDASRRDFMPLLEAAGYRLVAREPVFDDPAVRELLGVDDHFHLFER
jgi:hypothetical protein